MTVRPIFLALACAASIGAQQSEPPKATSTGAAPALLSKDDIVQLAKVQHAINVAHDSSNAQLAKSGNKKLESQQQLMERFKAEVEQILHHSGLTDQEYKRRTFIVSIDTANRRVFDSVVMRLTGAPLPGIANAPAKLPVPPGAVGVHIGHVVNGHTETPALAGMLPAAVAEARIAIQHATLATRQPTNLDYMKTHSAHVVHALDPKLVPPGAAGMPGLGYGVKKAADGCASHIELAAAAEGVTPAVTVHAKHIAMACRNTIARADQLIALAAKVVAATNAAEAAAIVSQIASLADQLIAGADGNSDGRITWEQNEGGLQVADEHVKLMLGVR